MPTLRIDELAPGMVLSEAVRGPRSDVLLGEGVELNERHLRAFSTWGISVVRVQGKAARSIDDFHPEPGVLAAAEVAVEPRFRFAGATHPAIARLRRYAVLRRAMHLQGEA